MYTPVYAKPASKKEIEAVAKMRAGLTGTLLEDDHSDFLSDYTLLRFLRQKDCKYEKGLKLLEACIAWRREYKPHRVEYKDVEARIRELRDTYPLGKTKEGVPVMYAKPKVGRDTTKVDEDIRLMVWNYEELHRRGFPEVACVADLTLFDRVPSSDEMKCQEKFDAITHHYYPLIETKVLIMFMPMLMRAVFAIASAFLSSAQKDTIETGVKPKHLKQWIDDDNIPEEYLGAAVVPKLEDGSYDVLSMYPTKSSSLKATGAAAPTAATTTVIAPAATANSSSHATAAANDASVAADVVDRATGPTTA